MKEIFAIALLYHAMKRATLYALAIAALLSGWLLTLQLCGGIHWSLWWVFSPLWLLVFVAGLIGLFLVFALG